MIHRIPMPEKKGKLREEWIRRLKGAAMAEWLSSWLAEQEDRVSIPGFAT